MTDSDKPIDRPTLTIDIEGWQIEDGSIGKPEVGSLLSEITLFLQAVQNPQAEQHATVRGPIGRGAYVCTFHGIEMVFRTREKLRAGDRIGVGNLTAHPNDFFGPNVALPAVGLRVLKVIPSPEDEPPRSYEVEAVVESR